MDVKEIQQRLAEAVILEGSQLAVAEKLGVCPAYISDVMRGTRKPGPRLLSALGIEKVVSYQEKK